ncbi:MAG: tRNA (adenosine(37)-N6)-dimethylallyltransferase MiaA [Candidatus Zixiibacteriota bacterium]
MSCSDTSPGSEAQDREIVILTGPTGSGKSALAHRLAEGSPISILSADSRQIVCGFDIGSAKPDGNERERYDYRLLDLIQPGERYSAFRYCEDAEREIRDVFNAGRVPLICGGTGFYLRALSEGIFDAPQAIPELRQELERQAMALGPESFHDILRRIDPKAGNEIHSNNTVRIIRALEIFYSTGKTKSELVEMPPKSPVPFRFRQFALTPPIDQVYRNIERRVEFMVESGWENEVRSLVDRYGINRIRTARAIGYSEWADCIDGKHTRDTAIELIKQNTRRFAKRQMTWLRGTKSAEMIPDPEKIIAKTRNLLCNN